MDLRGTVVVEVGAGCRAAVEEDWGRCDAAEVGRVDDEDGVC